MSPILSATEPGGLAEYKRRELDDGSLIEFELAPAGHVARDGSIRRSDWRAYFWTPPMHPCVSCFGKGRVEGKTAKGKKCADCKGTGDGHKRTRKTSVTTLLDSITGKGGLPFWFEGGGIKGCHEAHRQGLLCIEADLDEAVRVVRSNRLGAEAERDRAADRGLNVHALLEAYMLTGKAPNPGLHPEPHRGFIRALVRWLLARDPEPVEVEQLVCHPEDDYAGRMDLLCRTGGLVAVDAKTQANAGIYLQAHVQLALYVRAHVRCGGEPPDRGLVVVFAEDGEFREMELAIAPEASAAALAWWRHARPVESLCESHNRIEKEARRLAA